MPARAVIYIASEPAAALCAWLCTDARRKTLIAYYNNRFVACRAFAVRKNAVVVNKRTTAEYTEGNRNLNRKGNEVYWYSAILSIISKRSDIDQTVLPANCTMSAFPS